MAGVVHPVGPEEPVVYWRRRLLLALAAVMTLVLLSQVFSGVADRPAAVAIALTTESTTALPPTSPTSPTMPSAPLASTTPEPPASSSVTPATETLQPIAQPTIPVLVQGECSDADMQMRVEIDRTTTAVGEGIHIEMILKNTSTKTCNRDVGSGVNEITVISGPALIWSTDHCNPDTEKNMKELAPGQEWNVKVVWIGKQTAKGCEVRNMAQPGAYWAHGRNASLNSDGARFIVQ